MLIACLLTALGIVALTTPVVCDQYLIVQDPATKR